MMMISDQEILQWMNEQILRVDLETCEVYFKDKLKKATVCGTAGVNGERYRIEFCSGFDVSGKRRRRRTITRNRLIYMYAYRRLIPKNFEVHHLDGDRFNDHHENLILLHKTDHERFHRWLEKFRSPNLEQEETPF